VLNKIRINRKFWINLTFFILSGALLLYFYTKYRVAPDLDFAQLPLETTEGKPVHLLDYKGKVLLINFWQTWCGPCVEEMPTFEKARTMVDTNKVVFITITDEAPEKISSFRDRHGYNFQFFISKKRFKELGVNAYPTTYIIDRNGDVVLNKIGGADWSEPAMIDRLKALCQ